jgi:hypothetical protein
MNEMNVASSKMSDQGPEKTDYPTHGVAVLIPLKEVPFRHHTLVPVVLPLSEAFLDLTLGDSQQLCCRISLDLLHALKPIPFQKHFTRIGGLWHLWDLMFSQEVLDSVGRVGRVVSRCS